MSLSAEYPAEPGHDDPADLTGDDRDWRALLVRLHDALSRADDGLPVSALMGATGVGYDDSRSALIWLSRNGFAYPSGDRAAWRRWHARGFPEDLLARTAKRHTAPTPTLPPPPPPSPSPPRPRDRTPTTATHRRPGRPATGKRPAIAVRVEPELMEWIGAETVRRDLWMPSGRPNRSELVRQLLHEARRADQIAQGQQFAHSTSGDPPPEAGRPGVS